MSNDALFRSELFETNETYRIIVNAELKLQQCEILNIQQNLKMMKILKTSIFSNRNIYFNIQTENLI